MENKATIKAILVGYGYWGVNLLRNMVQNPRLEVVGVVDQKTQSLDKVRSLYPHIPTFRSVDEALIASKPQAAVIATPPEQHCAVALQCISAGCHVLVEKPLALSVIECDQILEAAKRHGRHVMVDHTFVYHPAVDCLHDQVQQGHLGDLLYYDSVRVNLGGFQPTNVLWDLAPHDLSILDRLTGGQMPNQVSALGVKHFGSPVESMCYVTISYPGDRIAHLHLNWAAPAKVRQIMLGGTKKMAIYDDNDPMQKVRIYDKGVKFDGEDPTQFRINYRVGDMVAPMIPQKEALTSMMGEFAACIDQDRPPLTDGESGRRMVRVLEAVAESMARQGQPISVSDLAPAGPVKVAS